MFANTRAINGIIAILALFLIVTLFPAVGVSSVITQIATVCALVVIFFICDCIFRKKGERSDLWFGFVWMLFHVFTLYTGVQRFSSDIPQEIGGPLFHSFVVATFFGLPFIANAVYLLSLLWQKRSEA